MSNIQSNNKRIAKNTLLLYGRMLLTMTISLYTSRVILQVLGIEDFGVYNVVGGIISMFAFINGGMIAASQRYITFEIGTGNKEKLKKVFSTSLQIHALISILILILGETIGLWFLLEKMIIPEERITAAMWVYQCSIITCIVNIMSIPYNAVIIAHEKMSAFAYISIIEVFLKLLIVYMLTFFTFDKLVVYSILLLFTQLLLRSIYTLYCKKHFEEASYSNLFDKYLIKEMIGFAGWSFWGSLAGVLYTQGINMMLNVFFGPVVNAARGIAVQVQSAIQQFVTNFQMALNPQITKNYATANLEQMHSLMFRSARFSFLLLFLITLPILFETHFLLTIWLKTIPENVVIFTQIMICISLIYTTANPCIIANQATGKVKIYQAVVGSILLMILPISYIVLKLGAPAYSVFIVHFCVESIAQFFRMFMLRKLINITMWQYVKNIYIPISTTVVVAIIFPILVYKQLDESWLRFLLVSFTCVLSVGISALFIGLTKHEREFLINKGFKIFKIRK